MSPNPPQSRIAVAVVVLLVAAVAPSVGTTAATGGAVLTGGTAATGASAAGAIAASDASFEQNVVYEQRGDVVNITVRTSKGGTVNLGSPDHGFWMEVRVSKGTTRLHLNTYKAGRTDEYSLDEMVWSSKGGAAVVGLWSDPIDAPLEPAQYPMNVTRDGVEQAIGKFVVVDRSTKDIGARIAPKATNVNELSPAEVADATTPIDDNETVARGDWLVLHVEATGLSGLLSKGMLANGSHGVELSFAQSGRAMNVEPNEFGGDAASRLVRHPNREGFYLFVDTSKHDIEAGEQYDANFSVAGDSYLADEDESVSTRFRVVERRVDLQYDGSELVVEGQTTIEGTTTLAPGTTVNVTARDEEILPFLTPQLATVTDDRTLAATFDFTRLEPGRWFEIRLRDQDQRHDAVVAGGTTTEPTTTTETPEPTTTATPEPTTTTETPEPTTTATPDPTTTEQTTTETTASGLTQEGDGPLTQRTVVESNGGVPGFDALVGLVALAAGVLLAVRRS